MKISEDVINDIRNSASITEVIGHYIPLVKKGKGFTAVCPFHDDHDPSLSISEDKQIYKCFVCGNGGNVFTFVQNYKKVSFPESVVEVSKIIGKPIEYEITEKKVSKFQPYYDVLSSMIAYGAYLLSGSKMGEKPMQYLINRGIDEECINYFNIGFNPENNVIYKYLNSQKFSDENIIKAGACRMLDKGMADIFYNRIIFPIHDSFGNPIAFTARDYLGIADSKYINSSEGIIYTKGDNLYNLHRAKEAIKKATYVIMVEGVMDVIAYHRAGKDNVVATLGTACTNKQIELIKNITKKVVLSYDGDDPGQAANMKIGNILLSNDFNVSVIDNDSKLDPDEVINQYGKNALRDLEAKQISFIDFAIKYYKKRYNLENYNDRKSMTLTISNLIDKLEDEYDRQNYYNELYQLTKIHKRDSNNSPKKSYNDKAVNVSFSIDGLTKAEYSILVQIAMSRKALDEYQSTLGCLLQEENEKLAMLIVDDYRKNEKCSLSRIYDETNDEEIKNTITNLVSVEGLPSDYDKTLLQSSINKVKLEIKRRKLDVLKQKITETQVVDPLTSQKYLQEYIELVKELGGKDGK